MQLFYTLNIQDNIALIEGQELTHCTKVLRKSVGDQIYLLDGNGRLYEGILKEANKKIGKLEIVNVIREEPRKKGLPHLGIGVIKNTSRMEWLIEKATEIGVASITPLICQRSERSKVNVERMDKIIVSAMKQSMRLYKPALSEPMKYSEYLNQVAAKQKYIGHYAADNVQLSEVSCDSDEEISMLIGPEGDFTESEVVLASQSGYQTVNLGNSRLRTETAGIVALTLLNNK